MSRREYCYQRFGMTLVLSFYVIAVSSNLYLWQRGSRGSPNRNKKGCSKEIVKILIANNSIDKNGRLRVSLHKEIIRKDVAPKIY